jgi:hypothetical protein
MEDVARSAVNCGVENAAPVVAVDAVCRRNSDIETDTLMVDGEFSF